MFKVTKRDGRPAEIELAKTKKAVTGAFLETKTPFDDDITTTLALKARLDAQKAAYTTVDAEKHPEYAIRLGMTSVPVLFANGIRYNGLGPAPGWLDARKDP